MEGLEKSRLMWIKWINKRAISLLFALCHYTVYNKAYFLCSVFDIIQRYETRYFPYLYFCRNPVAIEFNQGADERCAVGYCVG